MRSALLWSALLLVPSAPLHAQAEDLTARVRAEVAKFPGKVSLMAKNLDTGAVFLHGADDRVRTASTIKLAVMVECFAQVEEGKLKWTDEFTLTKPNRVSGSGVLMELSDGVRLPLQDVMHLMIVVSDNTATNMILDRVTTDAVNSRMDALGLKQTRLLRKVLTGGSPSGVSRAGQVEDNKKFGLGVTTPRDMLMLMEKLERGEVVSPAASREMLSVLKRQQVRDGIPRDLPENVSVANKTGALDHLRSDVAVVYSPRGRVAMAITVEDIPEVRYGVENSGLLLISHLASILLNGLGR